MRLYRFDEMTCASACDASAHFRCWRRALPSIASAAPLVARPTSLPVYDGGSAAAASVRSRSICAYTSATVDDPSRFVASDGAVISGMFPPKRFTRLKYSRARMNFASPTTRPRSVASIPSIPETFATTWLARKIAW
jgi:hypothetical protein